MATSDSLGSLNICSTCDVHIFVIFGHFTGCANVGSCKFFHTHISTLLSRGLPWPDSCISSSSSTFLLCPLGTLISQWTVLHPQLLHHMFLLSPSPYSYSPLLFLNHYSFSVSDNCSFEAYAVPLNLSFINISSSVNFSAWFVSHLTGSGRKNVHTPSILLRQSMECYLEGRIRADTGKVDWGDRQNVGAT